MLNQSSWRAVVAEAEYVIEFLQERLDGWRIYRATCTTDSPAEHIALGKITELKEIIAELEKRRDVLAQAGSLNIKVSP